MDLSTPPADVTPAEDAGPGAAAPAPDSGAVAAAVTGDPAPGPDAHADDGATPARPAKRAGVGTRGSRARRHRPQHPLRRRIGLGALAVLLVLLVPVGWSYGHALTRPGNESVGIRTTEWLRDHHARGIVAWAENFWYSHHKPKKGGLPAASALPTTTSAPPAAPTTTAVPVDVPVPVRLLATPPLANEGQWQPTGRRALDGLPFLYTTFMRPDPVHTSLVTGLAWMDPKIVRLDLYSGYQEPGGHGWALTAPIPYSARSSLVAAFNSGFKLADSRGGYLAEGRVALGHPLVTGRAALIVYNDGTATVGMWGRDAVAGPSIRAVRENLQLLIDGGAEAPNLDVNSLATWGWTVKNQTLVWRSGVGVDAKGHLIYAAGNGLSVHSLADVLLAAGAVRAMELDINSEWTSFVSYTSDPAVPGGTVGSKLIPDMRTSPSRYFSSSDRDFFAVFAR